MTVLKARLSYVEPDDENCNVLQLCYEASAEFFDKSENLGECHIPMCILFSERS